MSAIATKDRSEFKQRKPGISADHTSHLGMPGPEELVPSRYALRVARLT
jgi:hypothetical protein